ncbi:DUF6323 family protein [Adlercreutzia sp. ZJ304]|uniref:DUF6323 family protein n=1 Tax=Adlercreutzia sp. ZJ304 TaxID=2709791 RepID=UPI0013ECCEDB|nr:DUF6323 family protein [Adlercreutzia sp. ZJ304]
MGANAWLAMRMVGGTEDMLDELNRRLAVSDMAITGEDVRILAERRAESLAETERVEFGTPAIFAIAEAVASSPSIAQDVVVDTLADLQDAFYALRDELPVDVPDAEITEALRGCLDEWGDAAMVASMSADEVMGFSAEYVRAAEAEGSEAYCIVDNEGRMYTFDAAEWDYNEQADGWDGERWADGWDD